MNVKEFDCVVVGGGPGDGRLRFIWLVTVGEWPFSTQEIAEPV